MIFVIVLSTATPSRRLKNAGQYIRTGLGDVLGSWNVFFFTPRFPCKNLRLWLPVLGTGAPIRRTSKDQQARIARRHVVRLDGFWSGHHLFSNSATVMRDMALRRCFRDRRFSGASSSSSSVRPSARPAFQQQLLHGDR